MIVELKNSPLGVIPQNWGILSTDEIGEITSSKRIHSADYTQYGTPFFRGKEITQLAKGKNLTDIVYIKTTTFNELKKKFGAPIAGDILITAVGTIGSVYLVKEGDEFYFKDGNLMWIRNITEKLSRKFLLHYLQSNIFQNLIDTLSSGSSQKALTIIKFKSLFIPVPSIDEQQKIADILSTIDDKIEVIDLQIIETQELKKGLMQHLLAKGIGHTEFKDSSLGMIPMSWEILPAYEVGEITSSKRIHSADYTPQGIPFFRGKEITQLARGKNLTDEVFIKKETFEDLKSKFGAPKSGDILITAVGTIGSIYLVKKEDEFYFKDGNLIWIRNITKKLDARFLLHYLQSNIFQSLIEIVSSGSSQKALTIVKFKNLPIPVPNKDEQIKIGEILNSIDEKCNILFSKKNYYQELKQGLMQQLLTGKIRVKGAII